MLDPDVQAELGLLCARYDLGAGAQAKLGRLLEHLDAEPHAPTTVRRAREAVDVHVADSLSLLEIAEVRTAERIADLGTGVGFPGLTLAAALPAAEVFLVESARRKCEHVDAAIRFAGLENARTVNHRAEGWLDGLGVNDVVTARALAALPVILEYAAPLLADGGLLVAMKGQPPETELEAGRRAAELVGLTLGEPVSVAPYAGVENRLLITARKTAPTPARFPRRAGVAQKSPLA